MLNLEGVLSADVIAQVQEYTRIRFSESYLFKTPEALAIYEQRLLPEEKIIELCEKAYGFQYAKVSESYVPEDIVEAFRGSGYVPINYRPMRKTITVGYLPELEHEDRIVNGYEIITEPLPIFHYVRLYQDRFGRWVTGLCEIPVKMNFDAIVREAIDLGAADITISSRTNHSTQVYYNVRKRRVDSQYVFSDYFIEELIRMLTCKSPIPPTDVRMPKDVDYEINKDYRARVLINYKFEGYVVTIRLLPNAAFTSDMKDLNLSQETIEFFRDKVLNGGKGLRLLVGETMSGKNTTALSILRELAVKNRYKIVAVGMPVEQRLEGVEQLSAESPEEYEADVRSLVRMNPDFVYLEEIRDINANAVMQVLNTGKCVLSTIHANSVADTISRLVDTSGLSQDRVIQTLHSVSYQELVRDEENDTVIPRNRFVYFSPELKQELYGKSLGEVIAIINREEGGDVWTSSQSIKL